MSELTVAFIKAQSEFPRIGKDGKADTGKYSYTYATLPSVMDAVLPVLHNNGLALMQTFDAGEIVTTLRHASGESVDSRIGYPTSGVTAQDLGKWITYCRRYAIVAMLGLAPDDDDDAAGVGAPPPPKPPAKKATPPVPPSTMSDEDKKFLMALEEMKARMIVALEVIGGFADTAAEMQRRFNRLLGSSGYEKPLEITGKPARLKFYRQLEETTEALEAQAHEVAEAGI